MVVFLVENEMASSDERPGAYPARDGAENLPPGDPKTMKTVMIDKGAAMMQSLKPIKQMSLHLCSFACYGHDPSRQIEVNFYVHRLNQDFLQCAVYDCDSSKSHLIGLYDCIYMFISPTFFQLIHKNNFEVIIYSMHIIVILYIFICMHSIQKETLWGIFNM